MHWHRVTSRERGASLAEAIAFVAATDRGQIARWNVAGDLPGAADRLDRDSVLAIAGANARAGARWFTFTHYPVRAADVVAVTEQRERARIAAHNRSVIREATARGFAINVSANNPTHARTLARMGFDVATVAPITWTGTRRDVDDNVLMQCPASIKGRGVTCASCGFCARRNRRSAKGGAVIATFPAHGMRKRAADRIASN
jgi:hypothetical protein